MRQKNNLTDDDFLEAIERINSIWSFQQNTIPEWAFDLGGSFFDDTGAGFHILVALATESFGEEFARGISMVTTSDPEGCLIDFGPPEEPTLSRFIFISTAAGPTQVFLLERSQRGSFMFTEKRPDGCHINLGSTTVQTAKGFIAKIRRHMKSKPTV